MSKYIFITGVSTGIGRACMEQLCQENYYVIGTVRSLKDKESLLRQFNKNVSILICDITQDQDIENAVNATKEILHDKPLFALINNAGIAIPGPMHMIKDEDFEKQMNVNLIATRKITNGLIPLLGSSDDLNPRIIFMSSISGIFAAPFNGSYCVSKHALECLVDIYRRELHFIGIDVIAIEPGPIKTEIWKKARGKFDAYKKGVYKEIAERADSMIEESEKNALDVSHITRLTSKILRSKSNKNRYVVHKNAFLLKILAYLVPSGWVDKLVWKNLKNKKGKKYRPV